MGKTGLAAALMLAAAAGCSYFNDDDKDARSDSSVSSGSTSASSADAGFAREAARDGQMEIEAGRLAMSKASNADVRAFGQRMVNDHSSANVDLRRVASMRGMTLAEDMSDEQRGHMDELSRLSGAEFDRRYMQMMVQDHQKAVQKFENEANNGQDSAVRDFAARMLPTLREHLKMAQDLAGRVGADTGGSGR
jgi:putative membrane protein